MTPLTKREREVALLAAGGLPNKLIGSQLAICASTVAVHLTAARRKLRCPTRQALQLALMAPHVEAASLRGLTGAEAEIARLVAQGMSSQQIALRRGVRYRTISKQLGSIYRKLRLSSSSELLANLIRGA